jgi:hypothetical protein
MLSRIGQSFYWVFCNLPKKRKIVESQIGRSQIRKAAGPRVMATLRNLVISLLRIAGARYIAPAIRECARYGNSKVFRIIGIPNGL